MRFLLSAITSLSIVGSGSATLATNAINQNIIKQDNHSSTHKEVRVPFGKLVKLRTEQSGAAWSLNFKFDLAPGENIRHMYFEGGLHSYIEWGSDNWRYDESTIDVYILNAAHTLFYIDHWDFLAYLKAYLSFYIHRPNKNNPNEYQLVINYSTMATNYLSIPWGILTIGDAVVFSTY